MELAQILPIAENRFRRGFLPFWRPKETLTRQPTPSQRLRSFQKESIVTKRVPFGELVGFSKPRKNIDQIEKPR